jgi:hypothetical protein
MEPASTHQRMVALARRQHGVVSRRQLLEAGYGGSLIDHQLRRGRLWPVFRGVYAVGRPPELKRSLWTAGTLAAGPGAILAGTSAAEYWGIVKPHSQVEVHRPRGSNLILPGLYPAGRSGSLCMKTRRTDDDLITRCARPGAGPDVRSPAGVLIDLARVFSSRKMERAISEASRLGFLGSGEVDLILRKGAGRPGVALLREHLRWWMPEMGDILSVLEGMFLRLCLENSIEPPLVNHQVAGMMVDFVWLDRKVVVEVDGFRFHGDRRSFERDHARQARLAAVGYLRLAFTYNQVTRSPEEVLAAVLPSLEAWSPRRPESSP